MVSSDKSERKSGVAIAGLIIAILALSIAWVPILNNVAFIFAIISLVVSIKLIKATTRLFNISCVLEFDGQEGTDFLASS
jgi:hypothetical protein